MSICRGQLRDLIRRVLQKADENAESLDLRLYSEDAVELLMLTAAAESHLGTFIRQLDGGPALGIFQMEPETEYDIWKNFLKYRERIIDYIPALRMADERSFGDGQLETDLEYAILMARLHYYRVKEKLPSHTDPLAIAAYYKHYYNTPAGKATIEGAVQKYLELAVE